MIRRPPTLIFLEDDIESLLERICRRYALTLDFENLQLDDEVELNPSPSSSVSSGFDAFGRDSDINTDHNTLDQGEPSCYEDTFPGDELSEPLELSPTTDVISQPAPAKPCLKSLISNLHRSSKNPISSVKSRPDGSRSTDPQRLKVTFALSPQELELHSGMASFPVETVECFEENNPTSHKDKDICMPMSVDFPSPQVSFLSCGVSSSPATGVPLRDLTLASTMSYEAALVEKVSPASASSLSEKRGSIII